MEDQKRPIRRLLLKISGETLLGREEMGISISACLRVAQLGKRLVEQGFQLAIVIGGGNLFRGLHLQGAGFPRAAADQMGMLATLMNGLAMQHAFALVGVPLTLFSALECPAVAERYTIPRARAALDAGEVLFCVGGTGNPYFTTDTAAALRASEVGADLLVKATKVPGVFDSDPMQNPSAKKYDTLTYQQVLAEELQVMDATAFALCQEEKIPIFVCQWESLERDSLHNIMNNKAKGTWIVGEKNE